MTTRRETLHVKSIVIQQIRANVSRSISPVHRVTCSQATATRNRTKKKRKKKHERCQTTEHQLPQTHKLQFPGGNKAKWSRNKT